MRQSTVTALLQQWFEAEPWQTSRELLERLQVYYPDGLTLTEKHRMKIWRSAQANALVFGPFAAAADPSEVAGVGHKAVERAPYSGTDSKAIENIRARQRHILGEHS